MNTRRGFLASAAALGAGGLSRAARAEGLQKVRIGLPATSMVPVHIDVVLPEDLGYYKAEGLSGEAVPLGSYASSFANMNAGRLEFSMNVSSFAVPLVAKGELKETISFLQTTYPFRYGIAVVPDSPLRSLADFKGKRIGDSGPGFATRNIARIVTRLAGLDPDTDISWLGVGDGVSGGIALQRGLIDGLFYADNGFGLVEIAGIALRYLPLPDNLPQLGGLYLATTKARLRENRAQVVGFGRAVAKAHLFTAENPEAACYVFGQMFPEALPKGETLEKQVRALMIPVTKRVPFYQPHDPAIPDAGFSDDKQWQDEAKFANVEGRLPPLSSVYTNELVPEINDFDHNQVRAEARAFKMPYR